jgi:5'-nucleotidase
MKIVLTNDDGIFAPGLAALYKALIPLGDVTIVAPMGCRSGTSHSLTFAEPLTCEHVTAHGASGFGVHGSPADCVKLACMELVNGPIDLIVSGINRGANVGLNLYYSGTVAAALEGAFMHVPSAAISLALDADSMDFEASARYGIQTLQKCLPLEPGDVVNINIPRLSQGKPRGIKVVPQSTIGFHEYYESHPSENPRMAFQLKGGQPNQDRVPTDTMLLTEGYITITPLHADMTHHERLSEFESRIHKSPTP